MRCVRYTLEKNGFGQSRIYGHVFEGAFKACRSIGLTNPPYQKWQIANQIDFELGDIIHHDSWHRNECESLFGTQKSPQRAYSPNEHASFPLFITVTYESNPSEYVR